MCATKRSSALLSKEETVNFFSLSSYKWKSSVATYLYIHKVFYT